MKLFGKKVYTIAADYNYGQITAAWVKRFVEENGGEVVFDSPNNEINSDIGIFVIKQILCLPTF